ncbi:MAG: nucleotide exchange factor GrpE [Pelagibacteraceae bacterium]|jgi:molecular chaperone GrpE|nr:nucleotide exchange factor GrpE [Pelagibacteraceae bacterium]MDP6783867.1 nucleotide exchange factor GrpE [Alphaproteobacteria bacterium]MBO6466087.1 nucleotide exchange factor GrpE [Pelagibacteraceae bacterium]MBO6467845.1 nucleotide exchange factor GrpE [Pelagibacteraceae bacterium]MBO6468537.1 nucleotide exchange factor GrpE [Pelagibacteraceae bacterium]|tara:strand:- start:78 stop:752 length:675 start_codon:yes stop_codon:yes gene_type:complete
MNKTNNESKNAGNQDQDYDKHSSKIIKNNPNEEDMKKTKRVKKKSVFDSIEKTSQVKNINDDISKLNEEIENLKEEKLRTLAEMENLRKRFEKDKIDSIRYGNHNLARDMLTLGDNLSRALDAISSEENRSESFNNLIDGLKIVQKEFVMILEKHGVKKIESINKKFDHNYHQAMLEIETDEFNEGYVVQEIQSGFTMHDRLLRPSMVGVSKKPENKKKEPKKA